MLHTLPISIQPAVNWLTFKHAGQAIPAIHGDSDPRLKHTSPSASPDPHYALFTTTFPPRK